MSRIHWWFKIIMSRIHRSSEKSRFFCAIKISFTVMSGFSVVSLNTQGCRDSFKRYFLLDSLKTKLNADIVFLQDIHTFPSEEDTWKLIWRGNIIQLMPALKVNIIIVHCKCRHWLFYYNETRCKQIWSMRTFL